LLNVVAKGPVTRSMLQYTAFGEMYCVIKGKYFLYESVLAISVIAPVIQ
jgi:hypothetical protein